jgi:hypothetical protein
MLTLLRVSKMSAKNDESAVHTRQAFESREDTPKFFEFNARRLAFICRLHTKAALLFEGGLNEASNLRPPRLSPCVL